MVVEEDDVLKEGKNWRGKKLKTTLVDDSAVRQRS